MQPYLVPDYLGVGGSPGSLYHSRSSGSGVCDCDVRTKGQRVQLECHFFLGGESPFLYPQLPVIMEVGLPKTIPDMVLGALIP